MASPNRYGAGCVSAFLNFFDWTPAKRSTHSTKRLISGKQIPEKVFRRSRSDHNAARKPSRMMCQSGANVAVLDHATGAPGVVARLMSLESLPQPYHRRGQSDTPILLRDLLKRDYKSRRGRRESKLRKKSALLLTTFRCCPEVSCVSPAYVESRFLCTVARSPARTSSFLSRLPRTLLDESFTARYELPEETIPELSLRATTAGSTVLLQGWPLESQRIVPPNIFDEGEDEEDYEKEDNKKGDYEKEYEVYEKGDYEELSDVFVSEISLVDCTEKLRSCGESGLLDNSFGGGVECQSCWEDEAAELSLCCSGPSVSSGSLPSDVEDAWSSCAESHPNRDSHCHSPRLRETDKSKEVELQEVHQELPPTQFVKKMVDAMVDEELAPQPSPVSILDSFFLDEPCTPEPILTGSIHRKLNSEDEELGPSVSTSDKLRQALLDISMFQAREDSCTTILASPSCEPKDERKFIRGVLGASSFLGPSSPEWHDRDVAIDPSLFDKLESGDTELTCLQASGGLWRCDRRLLFDCVDEALRHEKVEEGVVHCRPRGERLVAEVGKWIDGWRVLASRAVDSLIEWDMGSRVGSWKRFGCEVEEMGVEVERSVWGDLLDEVVNDMVCVSRLHTPLSGMD